MQEHGEGYKPEEEKKKITKGEVLAEIVIIVGKRGQVFTYSIAEYFVIS